MKYTTENMKDKKFGRLTILEINRVCGKTKAKCVCECGKVKDIFLANIINGNTSSCGCFKKELFSEKTKKHGLYETRLYRIWCNMKLRCCCSTYRDYKRYGGKGIEICEEWLMDFIKFYNWSVNNGYQDDLTLDRINPNGNYTPENCRWTNRHIQNVNKNRQKNNTSGVIGVNKHKNGRYVSRIAINGKRVYLGYFESKEKAIKVRNEYILKNKLTEYKIQNIGET